MLFWSQIPLFRILLPFVFGIILYPLIKGHLTIYYFGIAFFLLLLAFLLSLLGQKSYSNRWIFGFKVNASLFLIGLFYVYQYQQKQSITILPSQQYVECLASVSEIIKHSDTSSQSIVTLYAIHYKDTFERRKTRVLLYLNDTMQLLVGDELVISSYFNRISSAQNPGAFDYANYMENKGVYYQAYTNKVKKVEHKHSLLAFAGRMRNKLIQNYKLMGFHGDNLSVLIAITLGDKSYLDKGLEKKYANAGAMHILAVSGLHLGIVFLLFSLLFSPLLRFPYGKIIRGLLLLFILWAFALLTGLSPSVQRAAIMFSFIVIAKMFRYNSNVLNSIFGSALLILLINPLMLFEVGFQLSYAAVLGIVWLHPIVYGFLSPRIWILDKIWSLMVVSISAQLATLPFILYYFHQFSNWFLLTNILVIPIAFFLVGGGIVASILDISFGLSFGLNYLVGIGLSMLNFIIKNLSQLPFFVSDEIWITSITAVFVGIAIISLMLYLEKIKLLYLNIALSFVMLALLIEFSKNIIQMHKSSFGIYAFKGKSAYVFIDGLKATLFYTDSLKDYSEANFASHLYKIGVREIHKSTLKENESNDDYSCLNSKNYTVFSFKDKLILFSTKTKLQFLKAMKPVDYFILNHNNNWKDVDNNEDIDIILDASILPWNKEFSSLGEVKNVNYIYQKGYFEIK